MALLEQWRSMAYSAKADKAQLQQLWAAYFEKEKEIYQILLKNPDEEVKGTVKELADKYEVDIMTMTGFLDGINDSLKEPNPIEEMEEDTAVSLAFDKELYIRTWLQLRLNGYMDFLSGMKFMMKRLLRDFTRSRNVQQQLLERIKLDVMIHAHVVLVRSIRNVVDQEHNKFNYMLDNA